MKISTIIPTYNSAKTLGRAIESVLQQTLPTYEIIIIDDGSVDETPEVINRFQDKIKYIKQINSGVSAARNTGIKASSGDWIAFLDADDEWLPNKLELQLKALKQQPKLMWCAGEVKRIGENNSPKFTIFKRAKRQINRKQKQSIHFFNACLKEDIFQTSSFLISRQIFSAVGTFDSSLRVSEDRDLWWKIAARYPDIAYVYEECVLYFVDTPCSLTKINNNRTESLRVVCKHIERARNESSDTTPYYEKYVRHLCFQYILRCASKEIILSLEDLNHAKNLINMTIRERILVKSLKFLPQKYASIIVKLESWKTRSFAQAMKGNAK